MLSSDRRSPEHLENGLEPQHRLEPRGGRENGVEPTIAGEPTTGGDPTNGVDSRSAIEPRSAVEPTNRVDGVESGLEPEAGPEFEPARTAGAVTRPALQSNPGLTDAYPWAPVEAPRSRGITTIHLSIAVVGLLAGAALFLSGFSLGRQAATTPGTPVTEEQAFVPFWDAYRAVTEHYAGEAVDRKTIIEGAIRGMIDALGDPYSSYLSSEEYRRSLQGISGQFEGIGAELSARDPETDAADCTPLGAACQLTITKPIEGAPAQAAGLEPGDVVTHIDGVSVDGLTVEEAVAKVRGPKGTAVVLTILRGEEAPRDISIVRDVIVEKEVVTRTLAEGTVGYVRLTGFSEHGAEEVRQALTEDIAAGRRKFVLDLRGNPGGFVTAARTVASQFIEEGPIFWQEDARGVQIPTNAEPGGVAVDPGIKVVVLVDGGSASAAEIVAGALQDTGRATIVGDNSFGKGTVQEWQPLPDDTGGFRLTVAKWLTPAKRWIHEVGVVPDVPVDPDAAAAAETDIALERALEVLADSARVLRRAA